MEEKHIPLVQVPGQENGVYVPRKQIDSTFHFTPRDGVKGLLPARYMFAVLASISFAICYGLKVNLSVAIVAMVNHTSLKGFSGNHTEEDKVVQDGPFEWNETLQGLILGSYFWGYLMGQLPGGRMSELYSAKWVMLLAVLLNIVGAVFSPVACYKHYSIFVFLRAVQGFGGGLTFPAMHVMISHWAPPSERSVIAAIIYAGTSLGTVISMMMTGWVIASLKWEWVFYIMGILSGIWCILWIWLVQDSPKTQSYIKEDEKQYIISALGDDTTETSEKPPVPWKEVFTSPPFYAILVAHFGSNCGWYMLLTQLPSYMQHILGFKIKENAVLSAIPYLSMWIFSMALSKIMDTLRNKKTISTSQARKICTGFATIIPALCFVGVSFIGKSQTLGVLCMTFSITAIGGMFCGFLANHIDIAPHFAGTLMAITNSVATIPGITVPVLVGYLTQGNQTIGQWRIVFFGTAAIYVVVFVVYTWFASGEEQSWNTIHKKSLMNGASPPADEDTGIAPLAMDEAPQLAPMSKFKK